MADKWPTEWMASSTTLSTLPASEADDERTLAPQSHPMNGGEPLSAPCTLAMIPDLIKEASFCSPEDGSSYYKVHVKTGKFGSGHMETRCEVVESASRKVIGTFTRPMANGTEMVIIGDQSPVKRKQWLSSSPLGMAFSGNVLGKFQHDGQTFKWIKVGPLNKDDKRPILELHSLSSNVPIARFTPAYLDPSAPRTELKIIDAILEIFTTTTISIEMIVFSFVLAEKLRRDVSGELGLSWQDARGRTDSLGAFTMI